MDGLTTVKATELTRASSMIPAWGLLDGFGLLTQLGTMEHLNGDVAIGVLIDKFGETKHGDGDRIILRLVFRQPENLLRRCAGWEHDRPSEQSDHDIAKLGHNSVLLLLFLA